MSTEQRRYAALARNAISRADDAINDQYWRFTRQAKGSPLPFGPLCAERARLVRVLFDIEHPIPVVWQEGQQSYDVLTGRPAW